MAKPGETVSLKVAASTIRTIEYKGGLDVCRKYENAGNRCKDFKAQNEKAEQPASE